MYICTVDKQNNISDMIHEMDKEALREYVNKVCDLQQVYNIDVFFQKLANKETIRFMINGTSVIKDTFDEAVCFLDGIFICLPYLQG